jgi:hypothetical protein
VLAVVAAAGWGIASLNSNSSNGAKRAGLATGETSSAGPLALNDVSNPNVLKRRVEAALGTSIAPRGPTSTTAVPNLAQTTVPGAKPLPRCVSTVPAPAGDTPELLGTATFHGAPALVIIAREPSRTLIFVVATADCRLLTSQFLKR